MKPPTRQELVYYWRAAKVALACAKETEMRWRMLIALDRSIFTSVHLGANTSGDLTLTCKETFTLTKDSAALERVLWELKDKHNVAVDDLVSYSPRISQAVYATLSPEAQTLLASVLEIKPATPTLTLKGFKVTTEDEP